MKGNRLLSLPGVVVPPHVAAPEAGALRLRCSFAAMATLTSLLFLLLWGSAALAENLRAGAAKTDITPTQPVTLAGYESRKDLSRGVHDPLFARALALEQ